MGQFLDEVKPDLLLLQETKCSEEQFPHDSISEHGYKAVDVSGGRWCGVAALAPAGSDLSLVGSGLPGQPNPDEARWIEVRIGGITAVSVYVPNGREVGTEHYDAKIEFLKVAAVRAAELALAGPLLIAGDMNVAPRDSDVWDTAALEGSTHVTPLERASLASVATSAELVDAHDHLHGNEDVQFTWWDYRGGSFHRGFGMRIDHFLISTDLAERLESCTVVREYRKGEKPSDHAPLLINLA